MVAVVVVKVDVDDEEGEGGGEDAQTKKLMLRVDDRSRLYADSDLS